MKKMIKIHCGKEVAKQSKKRGYDDGDGVKTGGTTNGVEAFGYAMTEFIRSLISLCLS